MINGVEPFAYFKATLTTIAIGHPKNGIDELLPWDFKLTRQCTLGKAYHSESDTPLKKCGGYHNFEITLGVHPAWMPFSCT